MKLTMAKMSAVEEAAAKKIIAAVMTTSQKTKVLTTEMKVNVESNWTHVWEAPVTSGKYLRKVLKVPLTELEARPEAMDAFKNYMAPLITALEERFIKLYIYWHQLKSANTQKNLTPRFLRMRSWILILNIDEIFEVRTSSRTFLYFKNYSEMGNRFFETAYSIKFQACRKNRCIIFQMCAKQIGLPSRKMEHPKTRFYGGLTNPFQTNQEIMCMTCHQRVRRSILNHLVLPLKQTLFFSFKQER